MPHRQPEYEQLWNDLEQVLLPTLTRFADATSMTLPFMCPYPRFLFAWKEPGDRRWVDLALRRDSSEGYRTYAANLPFSLSAGRVMQIRHEGSVRAHELLFSRYRDRPLESLLPSLEDDLLECWRTIANWTSNDFLKLGRVVEVPSNLVEI